MFFVLYFFGARSQICSVWQIVLGVNFGPGMSLHLNPPGLDLSNHNPSPTGCPERSTKCMHNPVCSFITSSVKSQLCFCVVSHPGLQGPKQICKLLRCPTWQRWRVPCNHLKSKVAATSGKKSTRPASFVWFLAGKQYIGKTRGGYITFRQWS